MTNSTAIGTLQQKIADLNDQIERANAELSIEASLERVRAVAMAMKIPDDLLSICEVLFAELELLGIKELRNAMVNIYNDDKNTFLNYDFSGSLGQSITVFSMIDTHPVPDYITKQIRQAKSPFAEIALTGVQLADWIGFREKNGELPDPKLKNASTLCYYFYSVGKAAIGISTLSSITKQEHEMLKRFSNVFDLAYKRYTDIKKAEAQAREAEIQLALERVRARTMAMRHSDELTEVVKLLYEEFDKLKINNESTDIEIALIDEETGIAKVWAHFYLSDGTISTFKLPLTYIEEINNEFNIWKATPVEKRNEIFLTTVFSGDLSEKFIRITEDFPELAEIFSPLIEAKITKWVTHNAYFSHGFLTLQGIEAYSPEIQEIQKRFAKVFEQTYTRFLDLQKAEAQAREAQIETGLERVRSRSLAMHKTFELQEVIHTVHKELLNLNIAIDGGSFIAINSDIETELRCWGSGGTANTSDEVHLPLYEKPFCTNLINGIKNGPGFFTEEYTQQEKKEFFTFLFNYEPWSTLDAKQKNETLSSPGGYTRSCCVSRHTSIFIINHYGEKFSAADNDILKRFGKVFEQSYTRFLDLQKAEAQAREAQIETGLERVRSKTMAMHKSEEVTGVAVSLNEELMKLGFQGGSTIIIINKETGDTEQWTGFSEDKTLKSCYVPYFKHPFHDAQLDAWKRGEKFLVQTIAGDEKKTLDDHYFSTGYKDFPENDKKWMRAMESVTFSYAFMKYGAIHWGPDQLTEEQLRILQRFSKVFEQSYTRFLDLKKAEAQAKEAQIEAALEKVRSRSLAMHKSEEISDVVHTVFEKLKELDVDFYTAIIILFTKGSKNVEWWLESKGNHNYPRIMIPYKDIPYFKDLLEAKENGRELLSRLYTHEEKNELFYHLFEDTDFKYVPENQKQFLLGAEFSTISVALQENTALHITSYSRRSFSRHDNEIFKRFAKVFDQAYTRFLDLQRAEAQAREAEIELALERVRARTMAMQSPTEFGDVITVIGGQFMHLGFDIEWANFGANGLDIAEGIDTWNFAVVPGADPVSSRLFIPRFDHPLFMEAADQLANYRKTGNDLFVMTYGKEDKDLWLDHLFTKTIFKDVPAEYRAIQYAKPGYTTSNLALKDTFLSIGKFDPISFTEEQHAILRRFGNAFGLAYTRFLDLQKAEAQAREAKIEAALERVRSKTMGMQQSNELQETAHLLFQQFQGLGTAQWACGFVIWDDDRLAATAWMSSIAGLHPSFKVDSSKDVFVPIYEAAQRGESIFVHEQSGKELESHYGYMGTIGIFREVIMEDWKKAGIPLPTFQILHCAYFTQGYLMFISFEPIPSYYDIFKRFAKVFEQTYTRFLDLQKAEAQAREAQIEAALERVRSRSMGMQKSEELKEVIQIVYDQFVHLNIGVEHTGFIVDYKERDDMHIWLADKHEVPFQVTIPYFNSAHWNSFKEAKEKGKDFFANQLSFEEKNSFYQDLFKLFPVPDEAKEYYFTCPGLAISTILLENVGLYIENFSGIPYTEEENNTLMRFGKVFQQTYTRFLDLQKAEAQAREAQIEAALERVRSKAMAMQNSTDLNALISHLFEETTRLDFVLDRCIVMIVDPQTLATTWILSNPETPAEPTSHVVKYHEHKPYLSCLDAWKKRVEKWDYVLEGEEKKKWDQFLFYQTELSKLPNPAKEAMQNFSSVRLNSSFSNFGSITLASFEPLSESQYDILIRFTKVFDLTYTRFNDLKQAEAQAREALIEAALERVRARALAMQEPEELKDVAQVLRNEMGALGVEELETCSIYIHEKDSETAECWYALKDPKETKKKMVADHFHLELNDTWVGREMRKFYSSNEKQTSIVMQGADRKEWINYCYKHSPVFTGFYGETIPDRTYHLYRFSHGYIGAAAPGDISAESWRLLSRAASVFSLAYSRFKDLTQARNDLIKLKEEKKRAEDALTELQATQKQLIQSEKMASLGELTAGIAHEIQNPLNFVNNFSDVSNELIEELKIKNEKLKIEDEEVKDLLNDIAQNLEKINHHGKRADAIVKGMLQHSRSSSGQKELTDINTLAEEYIRLAYHGLRAKDKFFNAKFETELDPSLDKINIVPQEIGRVILNLINNSFYAVNERKKNTGNGYEPMVTVSTKSVKRPPGGGGLGVVEISVKDNGNGIPQKVLDKIFQPFFTTKPTGEGTGLGLSLSYDIVTKGHNGDIKVETKEGEGSVFTITLPMN